MHKNIFCKKKYAQEYIVIKPYELDYIEYIEPTDILLSNVALFLSTPYTQGPKAGAPGDSPMGLPHQHHGLPRIGNLPKKRHHIRSLQTKSNGNKGTVSL